MGSISQNNYIFNFDPPPPVALFVTEVAGPWCQERPMPPGLAAGDLDRVGQKYKSTNFVECRTHGQKDFLLWKMIQGAWISKTLLSFMVKISAAVSKYPHHPSLP